ncbi:MAG: HEAT repeat domain-containing protein [Phycisphaeraceae bacterium]|nr:HEAT repeat domain-containing protein [Phycisphaeraceae bacterium]
MIKRLLMLFIASVAFGCQTTQSTSEPAPASGSSATQPSLRELHDKAVEQVLASSQSSDPFLRANAIEAAQNLPDRVVPLVQLGLNDPHGVPRFAALVTVGKLRLRSLALDLSRFDNDPSPSIRAAALYARRANGQKVDFNPMRDFLVAQEPEVRGNAAMLLGILGDKSAVPLIKELSKVPMPRASPTKAAIVRIQQAEALVRLGDDASLAPLRAGVYSQFDEVRVLSTQLIGRVNDKAMQWAMLNLLKDPPIELQLAAAEALARFGHNNGLDVALTAASSELPTARGQAALTLGLFNDPRATSALANLLNDPEEGVRVAAAAAILGGKKR